MTWSKGIIKTRLSMESARGDFRIGIQAMDRTGVSLVGRTSVGDTSVGQTSIRNALVGQASRLSMPVKGEFSGETSIFSR